MSEELRQIIREEIEKSIPRIKKAILFPPTRIAEGRERLNTDERKLLASLKFAHCFHRSELIERSKEQGIKNHDKVINGLHGKGAFYNPIGRNRKLRRDLFQVMPGWLD